MPRWSRPGAPQVRTPCRRWTWRPGGDCPTAATSSRRWGARSRSARWRAGARRSFSSCRGPPASLGGPIPGSSSERQPETMRAMRKRGPHLWIPFLTILTAGLACATAVVGASLRRWDHRLRPADWITLSRAGVAMLLLARAGTSRRTAAMDWLAWTGLLAGATVLDWLDGPLARRHGPTGWGTTADLEADSWLTFVGSV